MIEVGKKVFAVFLIIAVIVGLFTGLIFWGKSMDEDSYYKNSQIVIDGKTYDVKDTTYLGKGKNDLHIILPDGTEVRTTNYTLVKEK